MTNLPSSHAGDRPTTGKRPNVPMDTRPEKNQDPWPGAARSLRMHPDQARFMMLRAAMGPPGTKGDRATMDSLGLARGWLTRAKKFNPNFKEAFEYFTHDYAELTKAWAEGSLPKALDMLMNVMNGKAANPSQMEAIKTILKLAQVPLGEQQQVALAGPTLNVQINTARPNDGQVVTVNGEATLIE